MPGPISTREMTAFLQNGGQFPRSHPAAAPTASQPEESAKHSDSWVLVYDAEAERDYYFNIDTEESRWEPPEGLDSSTFRRYDELQQDDESESSEATPSGWHYIDVTGVAQGPFQKEELIEWRGHFPMNTLFWSTSQMQSSDEEDRSAKRASYLADVIGDGALLEKWKAETPDYVVRVAPSAADFQMYLENPVEPAEEPIQDELEASTEQGYADAVLAGLPPEDETIHLADLAKQSGTPLREIAGLVEAASCDGTTQQLIVTDPRSGKMTAVSADVDEGQQLYGEFGSWIDPSKMGEGLTKSAQYRREKLPALWMKQVGYKKRTLPWQDERYDRDN